MAKSRMAKNWRELMLERIAGGRSLRDVATDSDMPSRKFIYEQLDADKALGDRYARACEARGDAIVDEILEIADDGRNDWMEVNGKDEEAVGYVLNGEHVQRSKVRIDTRKWLAAKLSPKKYGDRLAVDAVINAGDISEEDQLLKLKAMIPVLGDMLKPLGLRIVPIEAGVDN